MQGKPVIEGRSCKGCTKCCEGTLGHEVRGHEMTRGKPCFFVTIGVGCGIYQDKDIRNDSVCSLFKCDYLTDETMPEEFKPSKSGFIVETYYASKEDQAAGINNYLRVVDAGEQRDMNVLAWAKSQNSDLLINLDGNATTYGSDEFKKRIVDKKSKTKEKKDGVA